ncbi:MAG: DUF4465 domain-containing protein [Bacteroidetes bacterium]|nr:DUF4465 domain-containing protein [Bacteroidota bacterium]
MKKISFTLVLLCVLFLSTEAQNRATFDNFSLPANSYYDGSDLSGGFLSGDAYFYNRYDTTYQFWASGFIYSNVKNDTTAGYTNEYAAATAGGVFGSDNYAVANSAGGNITVGLRGFAPGHPVFGFYLTNSTYAYLSMKNGDAFAKKFGGVSGNDPDWFKVTVKGWRNGAQTTDSVDAYLADFRSANNTDDYILKSWRFVSLLNLGNVDSLSFSLSSTDNGSFGMNTPAYFCIDNFMTTDGATIVTAPTAHDDTASTVYTDSIAVNILTNDVFSPFLYGTVSIVSGPQVVGATAYINAANQLEYVPVVGLRTQDTIVYSYCDEFNVCDTATVVLTINGLVNTAVLDLEAESIDIYPNPASNMLRVNSSETISHIVVSDISGRIVVSAEVGSQSAAIDISSLSDGVYTVSVYQTGKVSTRRLIKQ